MPRKTYILFFFNVLLLVSCGYQRFEVIYENPTPKRVHLYLDCSGSIRGFFHSGMESEVNRLLGNLNLDLVKDNVEVVYHKFDDKPEVISQDYATFSQLALTDSLYRCGSNLFSVPINEIAQSMDSLPEDLHLILTDGVVSSNNPGQELSDLKYALAQYSKIPDGNISLYQYNFPFTGRYYPQPPSYVNDREFGFWTGAVERNFYAIAIGKTGYTSYLDNLLAANQGLERYQHFGAYANTQINLGYACDAVYLKGDELSLEVTIEDSLSKDTDFLSSFYAVFGAFENRLILKSSKGGNYLFEIVLPEGFDQTSFQIINKYRHPQEYQWDEVNYNVDSEPRTKDAIKHDKTYQLDVLVEAFTYVYNDEPSFARTVIIQPSKTESVFGGLYSFLLGKQARLFWTEKGVYIKLFVLTVLYPILLSLFFFLSRIFDHKNDPLKWWRGFLFATIIGVVMTSVLLIASATTTCEIQGVPWGQIIGHASLNAFYAMIVFAIASYLIKNSNENLNHIPL